MDTKITKRQLIDLFEGLQRVGNLTGVKFAYAVSKNLSKMTPEIDAIKEAYKPHIDFLEYEKKRSLLAKKYSVKVGGEPQIKTVQGVNSFVISNKKDFEKEIKVLQKKYKTVIAKRENQLKDIESLFGEKIVIGLHKILVDDVPENITAKQMTDIFLIISKNLTK